MKQNMVNILKKFDGVNAADLTRLEMQVLELAALALVGTYTYRVTTDGDVKIEQI